MAQGRKLIDEYPLLVLKSLACSVGLNEAIFLQQVHFLCAANAGGKVIDGERWIYNTYEQWQKDHFPFWSIRTIKRIVQSCIEKGLLATQKPGASNWDQTLWYRVNVDFVQGLTSEQCVETDSDNLTLSSSCQVVPPDSANLTLSLSETSSEKRYTAPPTPEPANVQVASLPAYTSEQKPERSLDYLDTVVSRRGDTFPAEVRRKVKDEAHVDACLAFHRHFPEMPFERGLWIGKGGENIETFLRRWGGNEARLKRATELCRKQGERDVMLLARHPKALEAYLIAAEGEEMRARAAAEAGAKVEEMEWDSEVGEYRRAA